MEDHTSAVAIISRAEAKARGLKHYYTGLPCKHGHVAARYVSSWWCVECRIALGRAEECLAAKRAYNRQYRIDHPDRVAAANKKWIDANQDRREAADKRWRAANPDKVKAIQVKSRLKHRQHRNEKSRQWRADNPDRRRELYRAWCAANPAQIRVLWNRRRVRELGAEGSHTAAEVDQLWHNQRGKCVYCRAKLGDRFHRDHIVPLARGGSDWISNIQLLCPRCNLRKHTKDHIEFAQDNGLLL